VNVDVLPYANVIITSLAKLFSAGAMLWAEREFFQPSLSRRNIADSSNRATISPRSKHHDPLHESLTQKFVDTYYPDDAHVMELNSRDFAKRVDITNENAKYLAEVSSRIRDLF
jgi:cystathionine gamma-synthase